MGAGDAFQRACPSASGANCEGHRKVIMSTEGLTTTGHVREALGRGLIDLKPKRFPIRFDGWYRLLSAMLLLPPSGAYVEVNDHIRVQMGWAFRARFPRSVIKSVAEATEKPLSRGVHGFAGRWLVNGSAHGLLTIDLTPSQRTSWDSRFACACSR